MYSFVSADGEKDEEIIRIYAGYSYCRYLLHASPSPLLLLIHRFALELPEEKLKTEQ